MAGDWIKIEHALPNKPEVMAMAESLDISEWEVVGHLVCFWTWVDQNMSAECPVVSGTIRGLDRVAGRTGFAEAMIGVGWLQLEDGKAKIPNYDDHLSQSAKSRSLEAKRKRLSRKKTGQMSGYVRDKNGTETGLEESREEKNTNTGKAGVLSLVTNEILADTGRVLEWFKTASHGKGKILKPTEANKINVVALAQRVVRDKTIIDPVKVFVANVRDRNYKITGAEEDAAIKAIKLIERGPPKPRGSSMAGKSKSKDKQVQELAAKFGNGKK
jgi:hypothetical protein